MTEKHLQTLVEEIHKALGTDKPADQHSAGCQCIWHTLKYAEEQDTKDIEEQHSFWDEVGRVIKGFLSPKTFWVPIINPGGAIVMTAIEASQAEGSAKDILERSRTEMWKRYDIARDRWRNDLSPGAVVAENLGSRADAWQEEQTRNISEMLRELERLEKQDHWKGEGSEAYKKAIPSQRAALISMDKQVKDSAALYKRGKENLKASTLGVHGAIKSFHANVSSVRQIESTENWAIRMRTAWSLLDQLNPRLEKLQKALDDIGRSVETHQTRLTSTTEESPAFTAGKGKWPEAKGDTTKVLEETV
ncbi:hypothetical protein GCM10027418_26300 [Mariniluteicoccus endophyticus]